MNGEIVPNSFPIKLHTPYPRVLNLVLKLSNVIIDKNIHVSLYDDL